MPSVVIRFSRASHSPRTDRFEKPAAPLPHGTYPRVREKWGTETGLSGLRVEIKELRRFPWRCSSTLLEVAPNRSGSVHMKIEPVIERPDLLLSRIADFNEQKHERDCASDQCLR